MEFRKNGDTYINHRSEYIGNKIIVAIDSSKTNSCMFVADSSGNILDDYEIRGEPSDDILMQCKALRDFLKVLLRGSIIIHGGIEDIITKREDGEISKGMQEHESRFKITAIFMSFISYFQDNHDYTLELINNWSWKSHTLPEEFRTGVYAKKKKGSLAYHQQLKTKYANRKDDVTDAYQILQYIKLIHDIVDNIRIDNKLELLKHKVVVGLFSSSADVAGAIRFVCDLEDCSTSSIVAFMSNRLEVNHMGYCELPISRFTIDEVYKLSIGEFNVREEVLRLVVKRVA